MIMRNDVVTLVFATSGSGKSHFVTEIAPKLIRKKTKYTPVQFNDRYGFPAIIDGDELIADTIGWPAGTWWETLPADEYLQFVQSCLEQVASAARNSFVVFGVFPLNQDHFDRLLQYLDSSNIKMLIVNNEELRSNMEARKASLPPGSVKPSDWQASWRSQIKYITLWHKHMPNNDPIPFKDNLSDLFLGYLDLFRWRVRSIVTTSDDRLVTLVDGIIHGAIVRIRFDQDGSPVMAILSAGYGDIQLPEYEVRIYPHMSGAWLKWSKRYQEGFHRLLARHRH